MSRILRIDASARTEGSYSRRLADHFLARRLDRHPQDEVTVRDLARQPVPHLTQATIDGFFTPAEQMGSELKRAIALSDELIAELMAADLLLISTPMYNFSLPSTLKAWLDHIVRMGRTFHYSPEQGFSGLVQGKQAVIATATGAVFTDAALQPMDFMTPYLKGVLGFIGFEQVAVIAVEGTTVDEAALRRSQTAATAQIELMAAG